MSGERYTRNAAGAKDGAACYRTIAGKRWSWYAEDAAIFKAAGVRHRTAPGGLVTFVHPDDDTKACRAAGIFHGEAA